MRGGVSLFIQQFTRECLLQVRQLKFLVNSLLFLLMILLLFPLTLKPEISLLRAIAPGLIWLAMLLSLMLSAERLFQQDYEHGVMEQWVVSGYSLPLMIGAKVVAHWVFNVIPMLVLAPLMALLFSFSAWELWILILSLLCGTPALLSLCALAAAFGVGVNQKGALMALILLPLTLPLLVFGSGMITIAMQGLAIGGYLALLLAMSVMAVAFLPFAIAGIVRVLIVN